MNRCGFWLCIAACFSVAFSARPSGLADSDDGPDMRRQQLSRRTRQAVLQTRQRFRQRRRQGNHSEPELDSGPDPDERAEAMMAACSRDKYDNVEVRDLRGCVEELQKYASSTRNGLIQSIEAEKVFVREYQNAAKKLAFMGNTELFWADIQKEHNNALTFLTDVASQVDEDAKDLKVYTKLVRKREAEQANRTEGDEDEDEDDDEDEDSEDEDESSGKDASKTGQATTAAPKKREGEDDDE
ncbi:unnamed protein product [Effrenium voratum]|uniref:Uncharacterized protein n=1 Tax=Effrenium voratum TaxID=2562239 RepID=A0AA36JSP1_9DINO|nr:unnamed protein product [Effrenium voratum]CAJ1410484.1 unnamed protein product [Effrenium voratum]CAJ1419411.1 unnamed protein product [Effrenium voratum]|mmetsp:Transcript_119396/g.283445  ORF Transcript_119396/g.283445 Transcript_119396/m.283445 type:complete len:242 (-) Transcript_119396:179-904(-)